MSQAILHFHSSLLHQVIGKVYLKYASIAFSVLLAYVVFGLWAIFSMALLGMLGVALKEKIDIIDNRSDTGLAASAIVRFVDGGAFQQVDDERSNTRHAIVKDGGSFERFVSNP